jgi:hypothetical protein
MTACMLVCSDSLTIAVECMSVCRLMCSKTVCGVQTCDACDGTLCFLQSCIVEPTLVTSVTNNGHRPLLTLTTGEVENADLLSCADHGTKSTFKLLPEPNVDCRNISIFFCRSEVTRLKQPFPTVSMNIFSRSVLVVARGVEDRFLETDTREEKGNAPIRPFCIRAHPAVNNVIVVWLHKYCVAF